MNLRVITSVNVPTDIINYEFSAKSLWLLSTLINAKICCISHFRYQLLH